MARLIAAINVTADGFMARPDGNLDWHFKYWDGELSESLCQQLLRSDTILLGRCTYMAMADYWMKDIYHSRTDLPLGELLNYIKKVVVSSSLAMPKWRNTTIMSGVLVDEIKLFKSRPEKDIIVLGSVKLVNSLARLNLIDGYELWVHPVTIKDGASLFGSPQNEIKLTLTNTHVLGSGVVHQSYEVY